MLTSIQKVYELLSQKERRQAVVLFALTLVMALVQMVGVASIMPFMGLVANPGMIEDYAILTRLYDFLGFQSPADFLLLLGVLVLLLTALSNALAALNSWFLVRFAWGLQYSISVRLLTAYLREPYTFFLNRNTAALAKNILAEVRETISGVIIPALKVTAHVVVATAIFGLLVMVDATIAVTAAGLFGGAYFVVYKVVRRRQARYGRVRSKMNAHRFRISTEALSGVKETKVLGRERHFLDRFSEPAREYSRTNASNAIISEIPKYALETLAFGGILSLVLYLLSTQDTVGEAIAIVSLYAFAGYRLLPALQHIFNGVAKARFYRPALDNLHRDLFGKETPDIGVEWAEMNVEPIAFSREIRIDGVYYRYPGRTEYVARNVDLTILRNTTVGFVGSTGSGKTTLIDIVLGLLVPERGVVRVDGVPIGPANMPAWRRTLGYVPQHIFLCDDTIGHNIAFGLPESEIDMASVERAARIANLHDFVMELSDGYQTVVGDRGVRLSGGQRQRIGIARALYHDPSVLILDEATSALDGITEDAVMGALKALAGEKTIILVAHRLSTVKNCDVIYLFEQGELVESGTYDELVHRSATFRAMAKIGQAAVASG
jgi:ATP-binding cassette, subfamily B, bacterial PglK